VEPARISDLVPFSRYANIERYTIWLALCLRLSPPLSLFPCRSSRPLLSLSLSLPSSLQLLARSFVIRRTPRDAFENLALEPVRCSEILARRFSRADHVSAPLPPLPTPRAQARSILLHNNFVTANTGLTIDTSVRVSRGRPKRRNDENLYLYVIVKIQTAPEPFGSYAHLSRDT